MVLVKKPSVFQYLDRTTGFVTYTRGAYKKEKWDVSINKLFE